MENNYRLCESEQSSKQKSVRRAVMLIVLGLFIWQILNGPLGSVDFVASVLGGDVCRGYSELLHPFWDENSVAFENAVLFGNVDSAP